MQIRIGYGTLENDNRVAINSKIKINSLDYLFLVCFICFTGTSRTKTILFKFVQYLEHYPGNISLLMKTKQICICSGFCKWLIRFKFGMQEYRVDLARHNMQWTSRI